MAGGHGCGDLRANGHCLVLDTGQIYGGALWMVDAPDNLAVNSAGDAVLKLQVHFWDGVLGEDRGIGDITFPTC